LFEINFRNGETTMNTINKVIVIATRLAILALVFAVSASQGQTSRSTGSYYNRTDDSDAELNLDRAGTDSDVACTNARSGRVIDGFDFLRNIGKGVIKEFYKAWCASGDGTNGREGVLLIFRMEDGSYTGKSLGYTNEHKRFTFKWRPNALAIVHTHPNVSDPEPSAQDQRMAEKFDVPIFTITIKGMYVYDPAAKITSKVMDGLDWLNLSRWTEEKARNVHSSLDKVNESGYRFCGK